MRDWRPLPLSQIPSCCLFMIVFVYIVSEDMRQLWYMWRCPTCMSTKHFCKYVYMWVVFGLLFLAPQLSRNPIHFNTMNSCVALANLRWSINKRNHRFHVRDSLPFSPLANPLLLFVHHCVCIYCFHGDETLCMCGDALHVWVLNTFVGTYICGWSSVCSSMFPNFQLPHSNTMKTCVALANLWWSINKNKLDSGAWLGPLFTSCKSPLVACSWLCLYILFPRRWDAWYMWRCPMCISTKHLCRYVYMWVVFGLLFHVPQLPTTTFQHNENLCCINKSMTKHQQKSSDSTLDPGAV